MKIKIQNAKFHCPYGDFESEDWSKVIKHLKILHYEDPIVLYSEASTNKKNKRC
ncbi:hypothetical protein [[Eubacterium] cellulosolvens]